MYELGEMLTNAISRMIEASVSSDNEIIEIAMATAD
jgi:hypothetical protein